MFAKVYFPRDYFPPSYFAPGGGTEPQSPRPRPIMPEPLDRTAFDALLEALRSTGAFVEVRMGHPAEPLPFGPDRTPAALVTPTEWYERDDTDIAGTVRHVEFALTLIVRGDRPASRWAGLQALSATARSVVNGSDLGGACLPSQTRLRKGRYDLGESSLEQRVAIAGEFAYTIPADGRPT